MEMVGKARRADDGIEEEGSPFNPIIESRDRWDQGRAHLKMNLKRSSSHGSTSAA